MSENTPLLSSNNERPSKPTWKRYRLDVYIPMVLIASFIFAAFLTFALRVKPQLGDIVAQGTDFDSDEIKFLGVEDDGGILLEVKGANYNNYSRIEDPISRAYFRFGGFTIRKLNLAVDDLEMVVFDESKGDYKKMGTVQIAPFRVRITDMTQSDLALFVKVYPKAEGVLGVIKRIILSGDATLRLQGNASVKILVLNGYIPVSNLIIPLDLLI
ncbi:hypothetical protein KL930_000318 [Ogataea haglerorum]|uniref:Uncharacterized protein n=1 Tax=Ogataea haglerorum TaxID=1937702 RepID=A0AAN6D4S1_9ASCO|nr:uncharacterized protein KL911_000813 [Ogataea haglerorum]KAG7701228.1 hypothetical protein KL915_000259 [Ogataea haglerorum]KAG7709186.1 hypothetical protein KL914_001576 [Ogataea haglerorum]KAG7715314.1 hypothetical protein KL913_004146 [Ogataea haglerorum]KAG7715811.1 hypothetical protein KL949_004228 [Ogataea haglerorum]KAG7726968.1 hypothetical protein KL933_003251 [Ogataea haglerorum]